MKTQGLLLSLALVAAGAGVIVARHHSSHETRASAPVAASARPAQVSWARGTSYAYAFAWDGATEVRTQVGGADDAKAMLSGDVSLHGELTLRCLGERDGAFVLAASLGKLEAHRFAVLANDPLATEEAAAKVFDGHEAYVEMDPSGIVRAVHFDAASPEIFDYVMRTIVVQLGMTLPGDARAEWTATEPGPSGRALVRYETQGDEIARTRTGYETLSALPGGLGPGARERLDSSSRIALRADGLLTSLEDHENLNVATSESSEPTLHVANELSVRLVRTEHFDAPGSVALDDAAMRVWHPGDAAAGTASARRKTLEQLASDITLTGLEDRLRLVGAGAPVPRTFASHAAAFLRLHPEACDEIVHLFADDDLGGRGRNLAAGILAAAGSERAQAALRAVIVTPDARREHADYMSMVQRFSFIEKPAPENVELLQRLYVRAHAEKRTEDARAASYALGSTARHLARSGDTAAARASVAGIERDLANAKSANDKRDLLMALSNAGLSDAEPLVESAARDDDASVREAAASALRFVDDPGARATLVGLLGDASVGVGRAAIAALGDQTLSPDDVGRVAKMIAGGGTPGELDSRFVTFFGSHATSKEAVLAAIDAMAARDADDAQLSLRLRALRAQVIGG